MGRIVTKEICSGNDAGKIGAVRVSNLSLVDLAGSESVRRTGATGDRLKEGGMTNKSLFTLSRVIESLGQNATHVNFRDSKLTRILQPSLSGNARIAIICCASPSDLYLEETRSTLQFASRAKLVKTRAKVNEVMDDRSLIKKLQREIEEAKIVGPAKDTTEQMKALEEKAANAEFASRKAEEDLKRMKDLIMKSGVLAKITVNGSAGKLSLYSSLYVNNVNDETIQTGAVKFSMSNSTKSKKRRYSDGGISDAENSDQQQLGPYSSPARGGEVTKLHAQTEMKLKRTKQALHITPSDIITDDIDIGFLREALAAKNVQTSSLKAKLEEAERQAQSATEKLQVEQGEREMLRLAKQKLESQVSTLASDNGVTKLLKEKELAFEEAAAKIAAFKEDALSEESQLSALVNELCNAYNTLYDLVITLKGNLVADLLTAKEQGQLSEIVKNDMAMLNKKVTDLSQMNEELQTSLLEVTRVKDEQATELHDTNQTIRTTVDEKDKLCSQLSEVRAKYDSIQFNSKKVRWSLQLKRCHQ